MSLTQNELNRLPRVAVIIATHNYSHWLDGAIQSAALQDYPNLSIYVVDDNSEDNIMEVMGNYNQLTYNWTPSISRLDKVKAKGHYRVNNRDLYFISLKETSGPSLSRNMAIEDALNKEFHIIAILDADDQFYQGKISKCVSKILEDPQTIGGVYADYVIWNIQDNSFVYESKWAYDINKLKEECIVHSGAVINSIALKSMGLYEESMRTCEDFFLWRKIAQRFLFIHIPENLTLVRNQPRNSTMTVSKSVWEENYRKATSVPL